MFRKQGQQHVTDIGQDGSSGISRASLGWELCKIALAAGAVACSLAGSLCLVTSIRLGRGTGFGVALLCLLVAFLGGAATGAVEAERVKTLLKARLGPISHKTKTELDDKTLENLRRLSGKTHWNGPGPEETLLAPGRQKDPKP